MTRAAIVLALLAGCASEISAQSLQERIARDELAIVEENDPDIIAAIRRAKESLPAFLALARAPKPTMSQLAVKVAVRAGSQYEYLWVTKFQGKDGVYSGTIDNIPRWATHLKQGGNLAFSENEIVDWLYIEGGRMKGNFTICATLKKEPKAEAAAVKKRFGLSCD